MIRAWFRQIEWPTFGLIVASYAAWLWLAFGAGGAIGAWLWIGAVALLTTLHWSLMHEVVHGHPTPSSFVNEWLMALPLGWIFPYRRFRDTHLAHHATGELTDPFDDPESWYLHDGRWQALPAVLRLLLSFNNTLAGRLIVGPVVAFARFLASDLGLILSRGGEARSVRVAWILHLAGVTVLLLLLWAGSDVPAWQFAAATYCGFSLLLIRTFAEHQAARSEGARTVVIEDRGPLAWLFLFNNLHVAHHLRPSLAWYRLPAFYRRHRKALLLRNEGYVYRSYGSVFRRYFLKAKERVPHPFAGR